MVLLLPQISFYYPLIFLNFFRGPKEVLQDEEGMQILRILGKNMAWLLKLIEFGEGKVKKPEYERKVYTHFIR
jgi:hypothetical protein